MAALWGAFLGIVISVGASAAVFWGTHRLFSLVERRWAVVSAVAGVLVGAAAGAAASGLRRCVEVEGSRNAECTPLLEGPSFAWINPTLAWIVIGAAAFGLAGTGVGILRPLSASRTSAVQSRLRALTFVGPAMLFVALGLIVPLLRTIYLSLYDKAGESFRGLANYGEIFTNAQSVDLSGWAGIFGSQLFWGSLILFAIATLIALSRGRSRGVRADVSASTVGIGLGGGLLLSFAVFANLRGTVMNNLWWVVAVTFLSTALGLLAAVIADRTKRESFAKSLIFLPMAISFVGAGIIWRFMYIARPPQKSQTGLMNAIWVWLGTLRPSSGGAWIAVAVLAAVTVLLTALCAFGVRRRQSAIAVGSAVAAIPLLWLIYRFLGPGLGGSALGPNDEPIAGTILFVQESPFNNVWLMVVLIWIQTGFAMVILSAAIKAVPADLIEAARVDGADERQVFFGVTLPTIVPTITVVMTAMIVLVMKVFDIVRVMTNGNFGTQVIANEMWQRSFTEFNLGLGSALAVVLFLGVVPVMGLNIRRMQRGE